MVKIDIQMPVRCLDCPMQPPVSLSNYDYCCITGNKLTRQDIIYKKPVNCPLINCKEDI